MAARSNYVCNKCEGIFELEVIKSDGIVCPECKKGTLTRQWNKDTVPGVKFIGKGFYCNDSKDYSKEYE